MSRSGLWALIVSARAGSARRSVQIVGGPPEYGQRVRGNSRVEAIKSGVAHT